MGRKEIDVINERDVKILSVHTYKSNQKKKADDMYNVTFAIPDSLWWQLCSMWQIDLKGKPLGCGRQGCKVQAPTGMAVNGPCQCGPNPLHWEQKHRKEKQK